jgi:aspartate/methionine/tyrosine aminotransferase
MSYPTWLLKLLIRTRLAGFVPAINHLTEGAGPFLAYYSRQALRVPRPDLLALDRLREPLGPDVIDLGPAVPVFDGLDSGKPILPFGRSGCPDPRGALDLRHALSRHLADELNIEASPLDGIVTTPGEAAALDTVLGAITNPGDRVVITDPCPPVYRLALRNRGLRIKRLRTWMDGGHTHFRDKSLSRSLRGSTVLLMASPDSPTGGTLATEELDQIAWWAHRRDVVVIDDAAFARFRYDGDAARLAHMPKLARRTLTIGSLSKTHGALAARIGWIAGHRHLVRPCALVGSIPASTVSPLAEQSAISTLAHGMAAFAPIQAEFRRRRRYVHDRLKAVGMTPPWPSGGFFFWISVTGFGITGTEFADRLLTAKRVRVWPGNVFGPSGNSRVRLSYGGDPGRLREGLNRFCEFVAEMNNAAPAVRPAA